MATMALTYLDEIHKVEHYYVRENMCVRNRCPCSTKIDQNAFGVRASELDSLEIYEGQISNFYFECYQQKVLDQSFDPIDERFVNLLSEWESQNECSGLCKTPLFYFYKGNQNGPPKQTCKQQVVDYYWFQYGTIGLFGFLHGVALFLYFIVQFRFWDNYGR